MMIYDVMEVDRRIEGLVLVEVLEDGVAPGENDLRRNPVVISPDELSGHNSVKRVHIVFEQPRAKLSKSVSRSGDVGCIDGGSFWFETCGE